MPRTPSRPEQAAKALRELIIGGELLPGQPLREEEYAKEYEISRNTVREAFQLLAHEGLVEHIPYRGVHIRRLGAADIRALYHTRRLIEPLGIQAVLADPEAQVRLRAVVDEAAEAAERGDWQDVGTSDIEFHRILVDACGSPHLSAMFEQLLAELRLAFLQLSDSRQLHQPYLARNHALLDLIGSGSTARLAEELADYLSAAERDVLRDLDPDS
ncbi:GntR family transcriptional regulator [Microlunatus parietis]|uniref:DNA-binding GntR family transcriptional regulator n=1 Tax=Microlunatus parietis TaxID=682979 RepID=A0A7Y9LFD0_9ACTN|nr:GntR family transcriptional regulator [Microlunatus parietis]NYE73996.1 DNA-binding GntR family transcriptional regulator [Microlunatus parietis]